MIQLNSSPKISIIIPVYNVEKYLKRCLDSILKQDFPDWECILIDDGSPDNSGAICDEYAAKDSRFRVIHKKNAGVSVARNIGLKVARGEWIEFVDSDDWIDPDMLSELFSCIGKNDYDVIISGDKKIIDKKVLKEDLPPAGLLSMPKDFAVYIQGPCAKLFRKTIIQNNKIEFPESVELAEDLFFTFQIYFCTNKIYGVPKAFYNYFQNEESAVHTITYKKIEDEKTVLSNIEKKLLENQTSKDWFDFLNERKCRAKNKYVFLLNEPDYNAWRNCYPELYKSAIKNSSLGKKFFFFFIQHKIDFMANLLLILWKKGK